MGRSETRRSGKRHVDAPLEVSTRYVSHAPLCPHQTVCTTEETPNVMTSGCHCPLQGWLWAQGWSSHGAGVAATSRPDSMGSLLGLTVPSAGHETNAEPPILYHSSEGPATDHGQGP